MMHETHVLVELRVSVIVMGGVGGNPVYTIVYCGGMHACMHAAHTHWLAKAACYS